MDSAVAIIAAISSPFVSAAVALLLIGAQRRKLDAEAKTLVKKTDMDAAMQMIHALQTDNERLRQHMTRVDNHLTVYRMGVIILVSQIRELGCDPRWEPPGVNDDEDVDGK